MVAVCGLAMLTAHVAEATGRLESGVRGRLLARLDVAATVIMVVSIAAAARPFVAAYLDRRNRPSYAAHLRAWLVPMYALWIPIVVINEAMVGPATGPRRLLAHGGPVPRSAVTRPGTGARNRRGVVRRRHARCSSCPRSAGSPASCSAGSAGEPACCACPASSSSPGSRCERYSSPPGRPNRSERCHGCPLISTRSEPRSRS